ncbi:MAG: Ig-like domain-containing protein [Actinomycetota bacterium]|nr:Ig-like domain-containing protein [Actinomycetota bacterium]
MVATHRLPARRALAVALAALVVVPLTAGCGAKPAVGANANGGTASSGTATPMSQVRITSNVRPGARNVEVSRLVRLDTAQGTLRTVKVRTLNGQDVAGAMNTQRTSWLAKGRLEPGTKYVLRAVAADSTGIAKDYAVQFSTQTLSLNQQTFPSVLPLNGQTVGVGMPIMIHFDVPVKNQKLFEKHMHVSTSSGQKGSFNWLDSQNVHFRPKSYWKPGSKVQVNIDVNSLSAGNGVYGQKSRKISFDVGRSMISRVDMNTHQLKAFRDGKLIRTIPITTGMPGFTTRSGTKVIIEKSRRQNMNSETIGLDPHGPNGYNLKGVEFAMRLTFSGEFLHAAPWSVGSQGRANVSHGCTGMSTANASWLYANSMVGDPVEYTGSAKYMTLTNGYGDWNASWATWTAGSAL